MTETAGHGDKLNVFISYSRDDLAFADQLYAALEPFGFGLAIDRRGISGGEDWQKRLDALIRDADTVAFVLSRHRPAPRFAPGRSGKPFGSASVSFPCFVARSRTQSRRRNSPDRNYIYFYAEPKSDGSGFGSGLVLRVKALNTDLDWLREHTRYLQRATEWDAGGRPRTGSSPAPTSHRPRTGSRGDLKALRSRPRCNSTSSRRARPRRPGDRALRRSGCGRSPRPRRRARPRSPRGRRRKLEPRRSQREGEGAKGKAEEARRVAQRTRAGLAVAVVLAVVASWFAWTANEQRDSALKATRSERATRPGPLRESRALATRARGERRGRPADGDAACARGVAGPGVWRQASVVFRSLRRPRSGLDEEQRDGAGGATVARQLAPRSAPTERHVVTASDDKTARVWDLRGERPSFVALEGHQGRVVSASLSADGTHVVTASCRSDGASVGPACGAGRHSSRSRGIRARSSPRRSAPTGHTWSRRRQDKTARVWDLRGERPSFVALEGHRGLVCLRVVQRRRNACAYGVVGQDGTGVGFARGAPEPCRARGASGPGLFRVVQRRRNACGHGVRRQNGAGVGFARGAPELCRTRGAQRCSLFCVIQPRWNACCYGVVRQDGAGVGLRGGAAELCRPRGVPESGPLRVVQR